MLEDNAVNSRSGCNGSDKCLRQLILTTLPNASFENVTGSAKPQTQSVLPDRARSQTCLMQPFPTIAYSRSRFKVKYASSHSINTFGGLFVRAWHGLVDSLLKHLFVKYFEPACNAFQRQ